MKNGLSLESSVITGSIITVLFTWFAFITRAYDGVEYIIGIVITVFFIWVVLLMLTKDEEDLELERKEKKE